MQVMRYMTCIPSTTSTDDGEEAAGGTVSARSTKYFSVFSSQALHKIALFAYVTLSVSSISADNARLLFRR